MLTHHKVHSSITTAPAGNNSKTLQLIGHVIYCC